MIKIQWMILLEQIHSKILIEKELLMNDLNSFKTPYYLIDYEALDTNYNKMKRAFSTYWKGEICLGYSFKTNHLPWMLNYMKSKGAYAEVVSNDEYHLAELVGYKPTEIIFNGPIKTGEIFKKALVSGSVVNVDSFTELNQIIIMNSFKKIKVGLRLDFDLESECPSESAMGTEPSRFGFCLENGDFEKALNICKESEVFVCGIHMHQSTKTRSLSVFKSLAKKAANCIRQFNMKDTIEYIDIGGGFFGGTDYLTKPTYDDYARAISKYLSNEVNMNKTKLIIEPGASLVATPISYITRVIDIKDVRNNRIVTVDGSILHINPFLAKRQQSYQIYSQEVGDIYSDLQTICGSTCMENDRLMKVNNLQELIEGDLIEFEKCGSYTMCYNSFFINMPPAVYLKQDGRYEKVRESLSPKFLL